MSQKLTALLLALTILAASCQPRTSAATNSPAAPAAPSPAPTATAVPQPLSFYDALQAKVESGEWTKGQGLVETLKVFAGESDTAAVFGATPIAPSEGTGVLEAARQYLETGTDQAAQDEIQRLLRLISPSTEDLQDSVPYTRGASPAKVAAPLPFPCPLLGGGTFPCYRYTNTSIGGHDYSIYFPTEWPADDPRTAYIDVISETVRAMVPVYGALGDLVNVRFMFTNLNSPRGPLILADTLAGEPCPIIIYPSLLRSDAAAPSPDPLVTLETRGEDPREPHGPFKQLLAHELFHCFQGHNLHEQMQVEDQYRRWWSEGTAEYFSNVVFPSVNFEYGKLMGYDTASRAQPITGSSDTIAYGNFIFFQFLANRVGNPGVLSLLRSMPLSGGEDEQRAALAGFPNIAALFQDFAQDFWDRTILDTNGAARIAGFSNAPVLETFRVNDTSTQNMFAPQFQMRRYGVVVNADKGFGIALTASGPAGHSAAEPNGLVGTWGALPAAFPCGATPRAYTVVLTSTAPQPDASHTLNLAATVTESPCVPTPTPDLSCLVGGWDVQSYAAYFLALNPVPGKLVLRSESGRYHLDLTSDGGFNVTLDHFLTDYKIDVGGGAPAMVLALEMNGTAAARYTVAGSQLIASDMANDIVIDMTLDSQAMPATSLGSAGFPLGGSMEYTCRGNVLTFLIPKPGGGTVPFAFTKAGP
jgi:hypothetical protein